MSEPSVGLARRATSCAVHSFETLEPRTLFSAPHEFAGVGIRFGNDGPAVFELLGQMDAGGGLTGTRTLVGTSGAPVSGPLDWETFQSLTRGRLESTPRTGVPPYASQVGDQFLWEEYQGLGSLVGFGAGGDPLDIAFLLQRAEGRTIDWLGSGDFEFQYLEITSQGYELQSGEFRLVGMDTLEWSASVDGMPVDPVDILSRDAFGSLTLSNQRVLHADPSPYFNVLIPDPIYPPGTSVLIVDTDNSDGRVGFGIARRLTAGVVFDDNAAMPGVYRATILTEGPMAEAVLGASTIDDGLGLATVAIELDFAGAYRIYDLAGYDAGDRTVVASGTWDAAASPVGPRYYNTVLTDGATGAQIKMMIGFDFSMQGWEIVSQDGQQSEQLLGLATTFSEHGSGYDGQVHLDENGHPVFFYTGPGERMEGYQSLRYLSQDLLENWGGEPLTRVASVEVHPGEPIYMVLGVSQDGDVIVWDRHYNGRWRVRNLSEELGLAPIVTDIAIFDYLAPFADEGSSGARPALAVAGTTADGDLLLLTPDLRYDAFNGYEWSALNITDEQLAPFGAATPDWAGPVQGYRTSWGGMNLIGTDASGDLIVAWTAPGLDRWYVNNLSDAAGTPSVAGAIHVLQTGWDGIHIHALDAQGAVHVTWWVPQFGATWVHTNLTQETGGPLFDVSNASTRAAAFIAFRNELNTLNIVGTDAQGRMKVYWWSPVTNAWQIGDITNSFPVQDALVGYTRGSSVGAVDNSSYHRFGQSIYGYNADGEFTRAWWAGNGPDVWHVENLQELARPVVI